MDIRSDGSLTGDVVAARISIEDGAFFKGGIDIRKAGSAGRLRYIVVGAAFEAGNFVALFGPGREHDHGKLAGLTVALQRAGELEATHVWEHPVDEHQIGALVGQGGPGRAAILGLADLKAGTLQAERDHLAYRALILDD